MCKGLPEGLSDGAAIHGATSERPLLKANCEYPQRL